MAGVGAFVFTWDAVGIHDRTFLAGDRGSLRLADHLHADWLVSVAKVVTAFGSLPVAIGLVLVVGGFVAYRGDVRDAVLFAVGLGLTYVAVHVFKDMVDRPRPPRPLVDADGASYPSGHSAYAVTWVAAAVVLTRVVPGVAARFAFVAIAIGLAVVVGLTRIYLRVHYLSDVVGGWALAAAIFGGCAILSLVIGYVRNNMARAPASS